MLKAINMLFHARLPLKEFGALIDAEKKIAFMVNSMIQFLNIVNNLL